MVTTRLAPFFVLLLLLTLTGCLALAVEEASTSESEAIGRYLDTHEVEPRIAKAMYDREIVKGMTKEQVDFMLEVIQYSCEKHELQENTSKWVCEDDDPMHVGQYTIQFRDGKVLKSEIP